MIAFSSFFEDPFPECVGGAENLRDELLIRVDTIVLMSHGGLLLLTSSLLHLIEE